MNKAPFSHLVIARIFTQHTRKDRRGHIGADAVVRERRAITFSVGVPSLPPFFGIILCLSDSGEYAVERIRAPVENAGGCQSKLLSRCKRGEFFGVFDRPVVRQDLEDAIVHSSSFLFQLALADCSARLVFILRVLCIVWLWCLLIDRRR